MTMPIGLSRYQELRAKMLVAGDSKPTAAFLAKGEDLARWEIVQFAGVGEGGAMLLLGKLREGVVAKIEHVAL